MKHALRQRRYRTRLEEKVTDHSSHSLTQNALLRQVKNKAKKAVMSHGQINRHCCFCQKTVSSWFRNGFLRHHESLTKRDLPYLRPP
jgi:hypothetical protein